MTQYNNDKIKAILERYNKGDTALFNWCDEYNQWVNDNVACNVTEEWEYILKKSYEDSDAHGVPFSYDDYEHYYYDEEELIIALTDYYDETDDREGFLEGVGFEYNASDSESEIIQLKTYLEQISFQDLKDYVDDYKVLSDYERTKEIYQWFIIGSDFQYWVEKVDSEQVFLNGAWGRQCAGQSISLDYVVICAFIQKLKNMVV